MKRTTGRYVKSTTFNEVVSAFVPDPLPPKPEIQISSEMKIALELANKHLQSLNLLSELLPPNWIDWIVYGFARKEAVLSSQIEGTQASLEDIFKYEADEKSKLPFDDVREVCNYLDALKYAEKELSSPNGLPISLRLMKEMHKRLMKGVRGDKKTPGEFRKTQNWIGGTRPGNAKFVPPPVIEMNECLKDLEKFIHEKNVDIGPLIKTALIHVQFETIHPFLDGNGRIGRLLITLLLKVYGNLVSSTLYLSLFFKRQRREYYDLLDAVRTDGEWEEWVMYFLEGISVIADEASKTAQALFKIYGDDYTKLIDTTKMNTTTMRVFDLLPKHPILTVARVVELLETTKPTAMLAMKALIKQGVLVEVTGRERNRMYVYKRFFEQLEKD